MPNRRSESPSRCPRALPLVIAFGCALLGAWGMLLPRAAWGQGAEPTLCRDDPKYRELDFWVGEWSVKVGGKEVGRNRIETIFGGCAVLEHWTATGGQEGKSLFYVWPGTGDWKQIWVTEQATVPGGVKEKSQVPAPTPGALRFQGEIPRKGGSYLDRTTLTPQAAGRVRQHIEISRDGGETWQTTLDAVYHPLRR